MQTVRNKKVFFIDTLSADASFVLQHVQQDNIITKREYNNLNHPNHTQEKIIINLLDNVMSKGDEACRKFLQLLQREQLQETFPQLKESFTTPVQDTSAMGSSEVMQSEICEYKMSSIPRGFCLIINNMKFDPPLSDRRGSEKDEASLYEVFTWLGFEVVVHRNQTAAQMKTLLNELSRENHTGNCFVCCILSHGSEEGVHGTDGGILRSDDVFSPFRGSFCPSLAGKPKVFFIQACRGKKIQIPVNVQADSLEEMEVDDEAEVEMDAVQMISVPADGDFLVARSTVKGYYSFRNPTSGSWFIQTLCNKLKNYCPKGEDVQTILLCVNGEVSRKEDSFRDPCGYKIAKQMPVQKVTLRKKLVFHIPS